MELLIIGNYGGKSSVSDGQTIKTRIVSSIFEEKYGANNVKKIDTYGGAKRILNLIYSIFKYGFITKRIIFLTDARGIWVIPFLVYLIKKIRLNGLWTAYLVVGGWIPYFLPKHPIIKFYLKNLDGIYAETSTMCNKLKELGLNNTLVLPNCKKLQILKDVEVNISINRPLKLVTFSRVMKEKGIEDAINVVKSINESVNKCVYELDIYGMVDPNQKEWFDSLKSNFPKYITYKGIAPFDKSVEILKDYYLLLFPTRFFTEGIPGTIIDAYAAGLPVISAEWESYADVIEEGVTGYGFKFKDCSSLLNLLIKLSQDTSLVTNLKMNCLRKAENYTIESFLRQFDF